MPSSITKIPTGAGDRKDLGEMAIGSGAAVPALEDECAGGGGVGGGHGPTCSQPAAAGTPARPSVRGHHPPPRLAVLSVCPRPRRSHGAARPAHLSRRMSRARGLGRSAGLSICWPPSLQIWILPFKLARARAPPRRPPCPRPSRAGALRARGLGPSGGSGGVVGGEGSAGSTAQLSAGERRGLGLCLLRERQPRGGATARASPPPPRLRRTERVPGMRSRRATGQELSPTVPVVRA